MPGTEQGHVSDGGWLWGFPSPAQLLLLSCTGLQMVPCHCFLDCNREAPTCLRPPPPHSATALHPCWVLSCGAAGPSDLGSVWNPRGPSVMFQLSGSWPQLLQCCTLCFWAPQHGETVVFPFLSPLVFLLFCNWLVTGPRESSKHI